MCVVDRAKACDPGTELEREKGKSISFSISNILSKEEQQQQLAAAAAVTAAASAEHSDIEESEEEDGGGEDGDSEPPDDKEDVKERLRFDPSLVHLPGHLGLPPDTSAFLQGAGLADPLKSYLSAAAAGYSYASIASTPVSSTDVLTASSPLMAGLTLTQPAADARNVIKVPAHRPPALPLPLDYTGAGATAPWLYRPGAITGLPSYLPLPSSLLLNRFGGKSFMSCKLLRSHYLKRLPSDFSKKLSGKLF